MAPLRGESFADRAARQSRQAAHSYAKAGFSRVMGCLKSRPDLVDFVERSLVDRGALAPREVKNAFLTPEHHRKSSSGGSTVAGGSDTPRSTVASLADDDDRSSVLERDVVEKTDEVWDKNNTKVGDVPVSLLCAAPTYTEPAVYTKANIKTICGKSGQ